METTSALIDRRRNIRLKGRREAILVNPNGMHRILDISPDGLSFQCSANDFYPPQWPVEIVFAGTALYLKEVPVRFVQERINDVASIISTPTKDVGVEFLDLDEQTRTSLQELLAYHLPG